MSENKELKTSLEKTKSSIIIPAHILQHAHIQQLQAVSTSERWRKSLTGKMRKIANLAEQELKSQYKE